MKNNIYLVYVILDDCIWDDEDLVKIIDVTSSKDNAKETLKKYIENIKKEIDYDNLEFKNDGYDEGYVVDESDDHFYLYRNGHANSYHIFISISEKEIKLYKGKEEEYGL